MADSLIEDGSYVVELANEAVRKTIAHTFLTMLGLDAEVGASFTGQPSTVVGRKVAGVIGWVGLWNGTGIIECMPECACMIANLMLGSEDTVLNEDSLDAVAEMANIIFGGMKTELEASLGSMGLSTPTIIYGNDVGMRSSGETFTLIPVSVEGHNLCVKLYMSRREDKHNAINHFWGASCAGAA